jgi:adenylate cyclase
VPEDIYQRLKDEFVLQERGRIEVKGKGTMRTWYLVGRKAIAGDASDQVAEESHTARV